MIKIRVPATTANMGPGFDCFGMALNIYNEFEFFEVPKEDFDKSLEDNLIYKSMIYVLKNYNYKNYNYEVNVSKCDIPMARGLGSSASCIASGIAAANIILGNILSKSDMVNIATKIEGHPDNVTPAILGGMTISLKTDDGVVYSKVPVSEDIKFAVMVPDFEVSTEDTRQSLPEKYSRDDVVFNISRSSMMISDMHNGDFTNLRQCLDDKVHQPFRKKLIPNVDDIFNKSKELGSIGEFISGSGSTLIAIVKKDDYKFESDMKCFLDKLDINWDINVLGVDLHGIKVL